MPSSLLVWPSSNKSEQNMKLARKRSRLGEKNQSNLNLPSKYHRSTVSERNGGIFLNFAKEYMSTYVYFGLKLYALQLSTVPFI